MTWEKVFAWLQEKKHWIFISAGGVIFGIYYLYGESEDSTSDYSSFSGDVEEEMLVTDEEYSVETEEKRGKSRDDGRCQRSGGKARCLPGF